MNDLEKLYALLNKSGRTIKYGVLTDETVELLVCLNVGESVPQINHLGDGAAVGSRTVVVSVCANNYLGGFNLLEDLKQEIKSAIKDSVKILHAKDLESVYDRETQKYIFRSNFKIIKI